MTSSLTRTTTPQLYPLKNKEKRIYLDSYHSDLLTPEYFYTVKLSKIHVDFKSYPGRIHYVDVKVTHFREKHAFAHIKDIFNISLKAVEAIEIVSIRCFSRSPCKKEILETKTGLVLTRMKEKSTYAHRKSGLSRR